MNTALNEAATWQREPDMLKKMTRHYMMTYNDKFYIFAGTSVEEGINTVPQIYDINTKTWSIGETTPRPQHQCGVAFVDGKVYVSGGIAPIDSNTVIYNAIDIYDIGTDTWTKGPVMPRPRHSHRTASVGKNIYFLGGYKGAQTNTADRLKVVDVLNTETGEWSTAAPMNETKTSFAYAVVENSIFVFSGDQLTLNSTYVEKYDIETNTWINCKSLPEERFEASAVTVGKDIYIRVKTRTAH